MKVVLDLDSHSAIADITNRSPAGAYQFKSQDTVEWDIYFVQGGVVQDFGSGFALKFGMIATGDATNTLLAYQTTFTYLTDPKGNVYYSGLINFNTAQMASAIGTKPSIQGTVEIRYQDSLSEIIHTINISTIVYATILVETGVTPPNVSTGYPDASTIELLVHKNAANGYCGLNASTKIGASQLPVDGKTITTDAGGNLALFSVLARTTASFTTPASGGTVSVTFDGTGYLAVNSYVRLPVAGYYVVQSITDSTHAVLKNNGDPFNATSGTTIPSGTVVLPAQAAAAGGGGSPGQNAYTTTTASFTVPNAGFTVTVAMGSTAWLAGSGYIVFIQAAGYYSVSSITDATHAVLNNLGYPLTNASTGTVINSGMMVSPGGIKGADSTATGANAYDSTTATFLMPSAGGTVSIGIGNTGWLAAGQEVYVANAGYFSVTSISSPTVFVGTNSNYPGAAAPGTSIAVGSKVTPAGIIGPQGAGGPGLNAFTTLTSNFTQPAINSTVTAIVATTAWMAPGQGIYITGGGYYSVQTISDLTHVVVLNLGAVGNASPGATVSGSGTQAVSPAGTPGTNGVDAYTVTTGSFTTPSVGSSVTVAVINTSWAGVGQYLFIPTAGTYQVAAKLSATQFSLTNIGATGNAAGGTNIASGSTVSAAGTAGPAGSPGPQGAAGRDGAYATVYTDKSVGGTGGVSTPIVLVNDLAQGINPYYFYQRDSAGNNKWALLPVDGTTIIFSGGVLSAAGGGGGAPAGQGYWDPSNGLFFQDDFIFAGSLPSDRYASFNGTGGVIQTLSNYGQNSTLKALGILELQTGTNASSTGAAVSWGGVLGNAVYYVVYNLGTALTWKSRVFLETSLAATGGGYAFRTGIAQPIGTVYFNPPIQGFYFEYSPDNNSGQWRVAVGGASPTYTNTSVAVAADTAYNLEIDVNAPWNSITFKINGVSVATVSTGIPTTTGQVFWQYAKGSTGASSFKAAIDSWMIYYPVAR